MTRADVAVVGAGLVGLATARALRRERPRQRLVVLDKEAGVARHQSGRNSGVVHSGLFYRPGSLKARLCVEGRRRLVEFCRHRDIPHETCGKVVVARTTEEAERLDEVARRGAENGVESRRLSERELRRREPAVEAEGALVVPEAGIVDFRAVAEALAEELRGAGVEIRLGAELLDIEPVSAAGGGLRIETASGALEVERLVNCAGLHGDRVAAMAGVSPEVRIVPFRGEYYRLTGDSAALVTHLVYPVPDPDLPFLGVHLHRTIDGEVQAGPNAVLAGSREGYRWGDLSARDLGEVLTYRGFWRLAARYPLTGLEELARSLSPRRFVASVRGLVPGVRASDLERAPSGVRAQAVAPDGLLVDDFRFASGTRDGGRSLHVLNAPSPGATACLAIGDEIAARLLGRFPASETRGETETKRKEPSGG